MKQPTGLQMVKYPVGPLPHKSVTTMESNFGVRCGQMYLELQHLEGHKAGTERGRQTGLQSRDPLLRQKVEIDCGKFL